MFKLATITLVLFSTTSFGQSSPLEITAFTGYRFGGDFDNAEKSNYYQLDEASSKGILVAWPYNEHQQGELLISHYSSDISSDTASSMQESKMKVTYVHLGGNVPLQDGTVPIWLSGGVGLTRLSIEEDSFSDETKFSANIGFNTRFQLSENIALKLDSRLYATFFDSDSELFCEDNKCTATITTDIWFQSELNLGLTYRF
jgi:hypothetical protein